MIRRAPQVVAMSVAILSSAVALAAEATAIARTKDRLPQGGERAGAESRLAEARRATQQPPAKENRGTADRGSFRQLAPGVVVTIDREQKKEELTSQHDIPELLKVDPKFDWAKDIRFAHDIWSLEFSFKPMRFIEIDVPNAAGGLERKLIWYMVYRLKNSGSHPVRFVPRVWLESIDTQRKYPEEVIPVAKHPIQRREDRRRALLNSVEITSDIAPSTAEVDRSLWGVFTWEEIDPRTDRFVVFVQGLTNAYRWTDEPDGTHVKTRKTLRLNFWRPGDQFFPHESEIRFGAPQDVDYEWIYR